MASQWDATREVAALSSDLEGTPEQLLEELRESVPSWPLRKIRRARAEFDRILLRLRDEHPESAEVSYAGQIDVRTPLDQMRFHEQAIEICDSQIMARGRQNRSKDQNTSKPFKGALFEHNEDYRTVTFKGVVFNLTSKQASAVQFLHERYLNGETEVSQERVLTELGTETSRLLDTFRSSPGVWGNLIVPGSRRGLVRLDLPVGGSKSPKT